MTAAPATAASVSLRTRRERYPSNVPEVDVLMVVNKNLVVLLESKESRAHREKHPRSRMRYVISCTCGQKRRPDGHCIHTRAAMEDSIKPDRWKDIRAEQMKAPDRPKESANA